MSGSEKIGFVCGMCGYDSPKWLGRCPSCGEWNTMQQIKEKQESAKRWLTTEEVLQEPMEISSLKLPEVTRLQTGITELDRVLGGGITTKSLLLLGGEPGVGKSTLLLEIAEAIATKGKKILYITAEESLEQIKLRGERLSLDLSNVYGLAESNLRRIIERVEEILPDFLFIDSIQTIYHPALDSSPGSISQVSECGIELLRYTKTKELTTLLVGHITKSGVLAGPKTLEHMVDVILYIEGERHHGLRILRAAKNRFGSTNEIGVFEMTKRGLLGVKDPSVLFLSKDRKNRIGVAVIPVLEGERPILLEVQALVSKTHYNIPQRNTTGYDIRRASRIISVLEKRIGLPLRNSDIFINVTGGLKVTESGADLGIALSIASSLKQVPLAGNTVFIGEIGLGGEIRRVKGLKLRIEEAKRMGFKEVFSPSVTEDVDGIHITKINSLQEGVELCLA